jgi:hypothetical protein
MKESGALLDKPEGNKLVELKSGTAVKILKRQSFWVEVEAGGKKGWVKLGQIALTAGGDGAVALDTGRAGKGNIVATSAARGLSAKDLLDGKPDHKSLQKLEQFIVDPASIDAFRAEGAIIPVKGVISLAPPAASPRPEVATESSDESRETKPKKKASDDW